MRLILEILRYAVVFHLFFNTQKAQNAESHHTVAKNKLILHDHYIAVDVLIMPQTGLIWMDLVDT